MKWLKFLLLLVAIGLGGFALLWVIGLLYGLLSYVFWIGLILIAGSAGYVGYKLFLSGDSESEHPRLEEKTQIGLSEFDETDRALEEMRRKYLPEERK